MAKVVSNARICLVQGASRGLGLGLTKQLVARLRSISSTEGSNPVVIATCRNPDSAADLLSFKQEIEKETGGSVLIDIGEFYRNSVLPHHGLHY